MEIYEEVSPWIKKKVSTNSPFLDRYLQDKTGVQVETHLIDRIVNLTTGEEEVRHDHNLIVVGFGLLVASLLKGDATYGFPISHWAVGEGEGDPWDDLSVELRQGRSIFSLTTLYDETFREETTTVFIDENDDEVAGPTNRIEVRATFGPDVVGPLREFGIFGGNSTAFADSGLMIDHKAHTAINLNNTPGQQNVLIRALRIIL